MQAVKQLMGIATMHSRSLALLLLASLACNESPKGESRTPPPATRLGAVDTAQFHLDDTFVFELPDSGGYFINGQHVAQDSIPAHIAALFAARGPKERAVMVWDNPLRRNDAHWISRAALGAGGQAFDAGLSGWPPPPARP
jgi:hypothetical protein